MPFDRNAWKRARYERTKPPPSPHPRSGKGVKTFLMAQPLGFQFTLDDLATQLGLKRYSVSTKLSALCKSGALRVVDLEDTGACGRKIHRYQLEDHSLICKQAVPVHAVPVTGGGHEK